MPGKQYKAFVLFTGAMLSLAGTSACATTPADQAPATAAVTTPAADTPAAAQNSNIVRIVHGRYDYLSLSDRALRGSEIFTLVAHPDGTRTLTASTDIAARNVHVNATVRVDSEFRPIETFMQVHTQGRMKGSSLLRVEGDKLHEIVVGPAGSLDRLIDAPEAYSIASHPIAADSWQLWPAFGMTEGTVQATIYNVDGSPKFDQHMVGKFEEYAVRYLGERDITTPAGTFPTHGYDFGDGLFQAWLTGEDELIVEVTWPKFDRIYVLSEYRVSQGL